MRVERVQHHHRPAADTRPERRPRQGLARPLRFPSVSLLRFAVAAAPLLPSGGDASGACACACAAAACAGGSSEKGAALLPGRAISSASCSDGKGVRVRVRIRLPSPDAPRLLHPRRGVAMAGPLPGKEERHPVSIVGG